MSPSITPVAQRILANPANVIGQPAPNTIYVDAVEFNIAAFLANAFEDRLGLAYIDHQPDAAPLQIQLSALTSAMEAACSIMHMPAPALIRVANAYPNGVTGYKDPADQQCYSEFDRPYLPEEVQARLVAFDGKHVLTAVTKKGKAALMKNVKPADRAHYEAAKREAIERAQEVVTRSGFTAEKPYRVRLRGTGKLAWAASMETEQAAQELLARLHKHGFMEVSESMVLMG